MACSASFEVGAHFHAFLYESPAGYERRDFCLGCTPPADSEPVGFWRARRPEPSARRVAAFDREAVLGFFRSFESADTPEKVQFRFVLALLLWRKRVLKFDASEPDAAGVETWQFHQTGSGDRFAVVRPELDEDRIEQLSTQVEQLLAGGSGELDSVSDNLASVPVSVEPENAE